MKPLNLIEIETPWGYRTFELHNADITELDFKVDVIALSAFRNNYDAIPGTVIGALLNKCQIDVQELSANREFDLLDSFGCWVAKPTPNTKFDRILCVESWSGKFDLAEALSNLFIVLSILGLKNIKIESLALPILGAGQQRGDPQTIIRALLDCSLKYLNKAPDTNRILFVEHKEERARMLDKAMNDVLGRVKLVLPKGQVFEALRRDIINSLRNARMLAKQPGYTPFDDAARLIESEQVRSFEIGFIVRRTVEYIVNDLLAERKAPFELDKKIDAVSSLGIAGWIVSYMHVLRIFGNESAHEKDKLNRRPARISEKDVELCLFCLQRVLDFWVNFRKGH